ncbi:sulfatase [Chloroflexota bacterium]
MEPAKPNIILITIDSLRLDRLGCYGYSRNTSPNIDNLAAKGALFLEAISNGGRTPDSFPSLLASRLPPLDPKEYRGIMQRGPTLAGLLREAGYRTAAFLSNPFLAKFFHYDNGFDIYEDSLGILKRHAEQGFIGPSFRKFRLLRKMRIRLGSIFNLLLFSLGRQRDVTADKLTTRAISWLDTRPGGFFLWPHYMDVHYPYIPPSKCVRNLLNRNISRYRMVRLYTKQLKTFRNVDVRDVRKVEWLSTSEIATLSDLYDASIRHVDDNIGRLIDSLGSRLENTLIIVTSDHGEAFGEHNFLGHGTLYEELVRVPLIMAGPGIKTGTVVKEPVQLMDLPPTIVDLVKLGGAKGFHGRSLLPGMKGEPLVTDGAIATKSIPELGQRLISYRTTQWKYIRTETLEKADTLLLEELYDLKSDPAELHNLHGQAEGEAKAFELGAIDKIMEFKKVKGAQNIAHEKERIKARLKSLPG